MGFLSNVISGGNNDILDRWVKSIGGLVTSGVRVNHKTAMNYSAVWAASRLLTGTISTLPREFYRMGLDAKKEIASDHPLRSVFKFEPNGYQSSVVFLEQQLNFLINWGNSFAEIGRDEFGRVTALWPIHPDRIRTFDKSERMYYVKNDDGTETPIPEEDMFHVPGLFAEDGRFGKGVIHQAAESIGMGLATEQFGASFFGNGAGPSMVLKHPKTLDAEAAQRLRTNWNKRFGGPSKANGLLVLEEGADVTPITIPPEQAQFLQSRQFNVTEIARWYNVPPHMLRELSKSSFSNIESESLHYIQVSVMPWLVRWEAECHRQLLLDHERDSYFCKFIVHGLLRGDMETQAKFFKDMWSIGVYSVNDIRELLDMNPIANGEKRFVPMNHVPLESAGQDVPSTASGTRSELIVEDPPTVDEVDENKTEDAPSLGLIQSAFECVLRGLIGYEARMAIQFSAKPREFEQKIDTFYSGKFRAMFIEQTGQLIQCAGHSMEDVAGYVDAHIHSSKNQLLSALDVPMSEFGDRVANIVSDWDSRTTIESGLIFKGSSND